MARARKQPARSTKPAAGASSKKAAGSAASRTTKGPADKAAARKAPAKKGSTKKTAAKKTAAKKTPPKKTATKKATAPASRAARPGRATRPKKSPVSPRTLDRLRGLLVEERERLLHQAEELQAEAEALAAEREQGDTQFDEESGEGDTLSVEREFDLRLSADARQTVVQIDRALERMGTGDYGVCVSCGDRIPVARLEVIPYAELCVKCKQRGERRR
ncbi:MAG: TraR/DksA family transcriptional regulator [Acidimicrobiia bacterium]|nr:TraR/DksA family transcriptional regulator [Acidimicrobiia bacterium]